LPSAVDVVSGSSRDAWGRGSVASALRREAVGAADGLQASCSSRPDDGGSCSTARRVAEQCTTTVKSRDIVALHGARHWTCPSIPESYRPPADPLRFVSLRHPTVGFRAIRPYRGDRFRPSLSRELLDGGRIVAVRHGRGPICGERSPAGQRRGSAARASTRATTSRRHGGHADEEITHLGNMRLRTKLGDHMLTIDVPPEMVGRNRGSTPPVASSYSAPDGADRGKEGR